MQGVGFRPFVYTLALRHNLGGFVFNDSAGVTIEVEGHPDALDAFRQALPDEAPPLARIDAIVDEPIALRGESEFTIIASQAGTERRTLIAPDTAPCADCLRELFDPQDRRFGYPFINCTNCGPRFTIVQDVPYDRANTTMRVFPLCPACDAEYHNPLDRRFHAQPNACPVCGPQVFLLDAQGQATHTSEPILATAQRLAAGDLLAIKGLGGYHLACDALNDDAVRRLRQRKHREAKPFALMVPDLATARLFCAVNAEEAVLLQCTRRPVVLLNRHPGQHLAADIAPGYTTLGLMLPYTPLHALLLHSYATIVGPATPVVLVMTSGNLSDEPIAYRDDDAQQRLGPLVDSTLTHNRDIHMRCDDTVTRVAAGGEQLFRRSRGYAPEPIRLAQPCPQPILACGGHLKNTFCLAKEQQAFVSHHIGDLENLETLTSFQEGIVHIQRLFDIYPDVIAYDLHPDYLATRYALDTPIATKMGVQHHHAHIASVLAEHGLAEPVIGVSADGTGYGTDGAIWGSEVMVADLRDFERSAHLAYVPLPGGEQAVRQPWRMAAVYLFQTYGPDFLDLEIPFVQRLDHKQWRLMAQMIARGLNSPSTSSMGRLFDAVAALIGIRDEALYEGQAAIELEMCAELVTKGYPFAIHPGAPATLDVTPMIRAMVQDLQHGVATAQIAGRFHCTIANLLAAICFQVSETTGLQTVALSGGVFQNRLLLETLIARLEAHAFQVYINRRVPPNDGGLSLGQVAVAAARLNANS